MKLSDFVAQFLANQDIKYLFGVTGGANVHLFDSLDHTKGITPIFTHHEQAAALAAEAYGRVTNNLGTAIVTTGPGGTNAVPGVTAAWLDSIPCLYISGQTRFRHTARGKPIRQLGSQELDIVSVVTPVTKYAVMVDDPNKIKFYLQKATYLARSGRPGPVWVDIPLDFQWAEIEPNQQLEFKPETFKEEKNPAKSVTAQISTLLQLLKTSECPLVLAGQGIRLAHAEREFAQFIREYKLSFVTSWSATDIMPANNSLHLGRVGLGGQRGGNCAIANCDVLLAIGSHMCLTITDLDCDNFAKNAKKIIVDIDPVEINSCNVTTDLAIESDAKLFLQQMLAIAHTKKPTVTKKWQQQLSHFKVLNAIPTTLTAPKGFVNPYIFMDLLSDELAAGDTIVVDGGGTVNYTTYHAFKVKPRQRVVLSTGICAMGTGLPESIGACFANGRKRTICLSGDGSLQLNIHELQTIVHHKLPIKIFVLNNEGYLAIRHTQAAFLNSNFVGTDKKCGLSLPDYQKVAPAYGVKAIRINSIKELRRKIRFALSYNGPILCEIMVSPKNEMLPVK